MIKTIEHIEGNVDRILLDDSKEIYLVGTAHVSQSSADLAERIIREVRPDAVAVELCESRFQALQDPERWKKTDLIKVLKEGRAYVLLTQLVLASFQKKMGDQLKVKPGAEMLAAIKVAEEIDCDIILADRDVKTTLRRAWSAVGTWTLIKLFFSSLWATIRNPTIEEKEIEMLKSGDALESLLNEFATTLPDVKRPLIDERDEYLAHSIRSTDHKRIVAIVGAGHTPGICRLIDQPIAIEQLNIIPPASNTAKVLGLLIPAIVTIIIFIGFFSAGAETTLSMAKSWAFYTGLSAATGALLCLAHPVSILAAAVSAPLTTLHPMLAAGWFAGFAEAVIRKPQVHDLERIADDITSIKGLWTNRVARVFLVMMMTNITTSIGMIVGTKVLADYL